MKNSMLLICIVVVEIILSGFSFGKKISSLPEVLMPDHIYLSDHYLYVTQVTTIYIYSLKNYKLVKKFGKQGEGPREFKKRIDNIVIGNDEIMVSSMGRVSYFTFDGRFKRERNDIYILAGHFLP